MIVIKILILIYAAAFAWAIVITNIEERSEERKP